MPFDPSDLSGFTRFVDVMIPPVVEMASFSFASASSLMPLVAPVTHQLQEYIYFKTVNINPQGQQTVHGAPTVDEFDSVVISVLRPHAEDHEKHAPRRGTQAL